jgi:hypothetical protein
MKARTALLELFKESHEWRSFFRSCCESGALRLRSQAWQFCDELKNRGHKVRAKETEDALLRLAKELLPDAPSARWDEEWAHDLCKDALACLAKVYAEASTADQEAVDLSAQGVWAERMHGATSANDPAAFRVALEGWTRAGIEAVERLRTRGGAA